MNGPDWAWLGRAGLGLLCGLALFGPVLGQVLGQVLSWSVPVWPGFARFGHPRTSHTHHGSQEQHTHTTLGKDN